MIKLLILDDSSKKVEAIKKVLFEGCGLSEDDVDVAISIASGRNAVANDYYDLVLLDLVLPTFDNEEAVEDGGLSFIREISAAGETVKMPTQIIGLTEKEDAYEKEKEEFNSLLFSVIVCRQKDSTWMQQLKQTVNFAIRSKSAILKSLQQRNNFDLAIICALPEEFKQLIAAFGGEEKWHNLSIEEDLPFRFKSIVVTTASGAEIKVVAAMAGRAGVIATSVLTTLMFTLFHVRTVFMTGFSAGFPSKELKLGDILVASAIEDYASGKLKDIDGSVKLLKEIHQIEAPSTLTLAMQELIEDEQTQANLMAKIKQSNLLVQDRDNYQISMANTCCGPYVVTSEDVVKELEASNRKLEGLDMEGFGLYLTSKILSSQNLKGAMWIKGVGDFANPHKADGYHKTCSFGSAALLYQFIKEKM